MTGRVLLVTLVIGIAALAAVAARMFADGPGRSAPVITRDGAIVSE